MTILMFNDSIIDNYKITFNNLKLDYQLFFVCFMIGITIMILFFLIYKILKNLKKKQSIDSDISGIK